MHGYKWPINCTRTRTSLPEMRIDASDGHAYDKQSFIDVYGGTKEWDAAKTAPSDPKAQAATERGQYPIRLFPMHLARFWNGLQLSHIYISLQR